MATGLLARAKLIEQEEQVLVKLRETLAGQLRRLQVEELAIRSMMRCEEMAAEEQEAATARGSSISGGSWQQPDRGSTTSARVAAAAAAASADMAEDEINTQPLVLSLDSTLGKLWSDEHASANDDAEAEEEEDDDEEEEDDDAY